MTQQLHLSQKNESLSPHKNLYTDVHSNCFCNSQKLETRQMTVNGQMVKQTGGGDYYAGMKREKLVITQYLGYTSRALCLCLVEKAHFKGTHIM